MQRRQDSLANLLAKFYLKALAPLHSFAPLREN